LSVKEEKHIWPIWRACCIEAFMLGLLDAIGNRAEGDTGQNGDDPNDHEEFDEGETASTGRVSGTTEETVV